MTKFLNLLLIYRKRIIAALVVIAIILATLVQIKEGVLSNTVVAKYKDSFDVVTKVVATLLLAVGTAFTYYRFFKGRTFTKKLNIQIHVKVLRLNDDDHLHAIDLRLINVGSIALWSLRSNVDRQLISAKGEMELIEDGKWHPIENVQRSNSQLVIEPQETYTIHKTFIIPADCLAVTYNAVVEHPEGNTWSRAVTVANTTGNEHNDA